MVGSGVFFKHVLRPWEPWRTGWDGRATVGHDWGCMVSLGSGLESRRRGVLSRPVVWSGEDAFPVCGDVLGMRCGQPFPGLCRVIGGPSISPEFQGQARRTSWAQVSGQT